MALSARPSPPVQRPHSPLSPPHLLSCALGSLLTSRCNLAKLSASSRSPCTGTALPVAGQPPLLPLPPPGSPPVPTQPEAPPHPVRTGLPGSTPSAAFPSLLFSPSAAPLASCCLTPTPNLGPDHHTAHSTRVRCPGLGSEVALLSPSPGPGAQAPGPRFFSRNMGLPCPHPYSASW